MSPLFRYFLSFHYVPLIKQRYNRKMYKKISLNEGGSTKI